MYPRLVALSLVPALAACSAEDEEVRPPVAFASAHARIRVDIEVDREANLRVLSHARFLRYRDLEAATADVLAGSEPRTHLEMDRCAQTGARLDQALAALPEGTVLHHLDAGELSIQAPSSAQKLSPRGQPALYPYAAGFEYRSMSSVVATRGEDEDAGDSEPVWAAPGEVGATGLGGADVGTFDVTATLPPLPEELSVGPGVEPGDLDVRWKGVGDENGVIVSVRSGWRELRCLTADDGRLLISARILSGLPGHTAPVVAAERWRRVAFTASGIDAGEIEVAARAVSLPQEVAGTP